MFVDPTQERAAKVEALQRALAAAMTAALDSVAVNRPKRLFGRLRRCC